MDDGSSEELVKVVIELPEPDMGVTGERVWAKSLGSDLYEIRNSPWHSRQVNWGDIVRAKAQADDQWPIFIEVVRRSGHKTMHVYILKDGQDKRDECLSKFNQLGATYENADGRMYALDFEPDVDAKPVIEYLEPLRLKGLVDYRINEN